MTSTELGTRLGSDSNDTDPKLLKADQEYKNLVNLFESSQWDSLLFDEQLNVSQKNGRKGQFKLSVKYDMFRLETKIFKVTLEHNGFWDGSCSSETQITAYVNRRMQTLQQDYSERIRLPEKNIAKTMSIRTDEYGESKIVMTCKDGSISRTVERQFNNDKTNGLLFEGAALLLERYLVKYPVIDNLNLITYDDEGNISPVLINRLPNQPKTVDSQTIDAFVLEKVIIPKNGIPITWHSHYFHDGHLATRLQIGSALIVNIEEIPDLIEREEAREKPTFERQGIDWETDMELKSIYQTRKEELQADHETYLRRHPEVTDLLSDFCQQVLIQKPTDVFAFASKLFGSMSASMKLEHAMASSEQRSAAKQLIMSREPTVENMVRDWPPEAVTGKIG